MYSIRLWFLLLFFSCVFYQQKHAAEMLQPSEWGSSAESDAGGDPILNHGAKLMDGVDVSDRGGSNIVRGFQRLRSLSPKRNFLLEYPSHGSDQSDQDLNEKLMETMVIMETDQMENGNSGNRGMSSDTKQPIILRRSTVSPRAFEYGFPNGMKSKESDYSNHDYTLKGRIKDIDERIGKKMSTGIGEARTRLLAKRFILPSLDLGRMERNTNDGYSLYLMTDGDQAAGLRQSRSDETRRSNSWLARNQRQSQVSPWNQSMNFLKDDTSGLMVGTLEGESWNCGADHSYSQTPTDNIEMSLSFAASTPSDTLLGNYIERRFVEKRENRRNFGETNADLNSAISSIDGYKSESPENEECDKVYDDAADISENMNVGYDELLLQGGYSDSSLNKRMVSYNDPRSNIDDDDREVMEGTNSLPPMRRRHKVAHKMGRPASFSHALDEEESDKQMDDERSPQIVRKDKGGKSKRPNYKVKHKGKSPVTKQVTDIEDAMGRDDEEVEECTDLSHHHKYEPKRINHIHAISE